LVRDRFQGGKGFAVGWECTIKSWLRLSPEEIGNRLEAWLRSSEGQRLEVRGLDEAAS
jgi:hypothetical protein